MTPSSSVAAEVRPIRIFITVLVPFALGYFLSYLFRNVNAVIAGHLTQSVDIGAAGLGLLTSAYFLTFAAFQLPLGILLDRFGPRRVEAVLLLFAAAGAVVFAMGDDVATLAAGRALIGLGVSACLMAAFKANVMWWPRDRLPFVNGCVLTAGGLGAVFATTPVEIALTVTSWRGLFVGLAALTVVAAALLLTVVPEHREESAPAPKLGDQIRGAAQVFASGYFWRIAPASFLVQGTFLSYVGLWAGPWLREVSGLGQEAVAVHLQYAALAMAAGYLGIGAITGRLARIGVSAYAVLAVGIGVCLATQAALALGTVDRPMLLWSLFAFSGSASVLTYAILSQAFPTEMSGRVNTALNLLVFVAAFAIQAGIGRIIAAAAEAGMAGAEGHRLAMGAMIAVELAAFVWMLLPRRRPAVN